MTGTSSYRRRVLGLATVAALAVAFVVTSSTPAAGFDTPTPINQWGTNGSGDGQFSFPIGVALDATNRVYVVDQGNDRVQVFNARGTYLRQWGGPGTGAGQFTAAAGIAVDPVTGDVWVSDVSAHRVQRFSATGAHELTFGTFGTGTNQFNGPNGLAVDDVGNLYVVDNGNDRVLRFDSEGAHQLTIGGFGTGDGQFRDPYGIAVDRTTGDVYVADGTNDRIQRFDAGGDFLGTWGSTGSGFAFFDDPWGVAVGDDGTVYVTETGNDRVQAFTPTGGFLGHWGGTGSLPGQFDDPLGIGVDHRGRVQVADGNDRIQTFATARPDGRVRRGTIGPLRGDGIYNTNGRGQWAVGDAPLGGTVTFTLSVQNDAPFPEALRVEGGGSSNTYTVTYRTIGGKVVTSRILAGTYRTPVLAPGATHQIRVSVLVGAMADLGSRLTGGVSTISTTQPGVGDTVKFIARRSL